MNTTMDYQQQGIDFLNATSTAMKVKFLGHRLYFNDDKQCRDVFSITLVNKIHRFTFKFGQSINASTGSGDNKPTAYDVLAAITKYPTSYFEDFCSEFGYDVDSRKAYKIWRACEKEWLNIKLLFNEEQIEQLQEIN